MRSQGTPAAVALIAALAAPALAGGIPNCSEFGSPRAAAACAAYAQNVLAQADLREKLKADPENAGLQLEIGRLGGEMTSLMLDFRDSIPKDAPDLNGKAEVLVTNGNNVKDGVGEVSAQTFRSATGAGASGGTDSVPEQAKNHWAQTPAQRTALGQAAPLTGSNPAAAVKTLAQLPPDQQDAPAVQSLLAQAKLNLGDRAGALEAARKALALDPGDKAARAIADSIENQDRAQARANAVKIGFADRPADAAGLPVRNGIVVPGAAVQVPGPGVVPPNVRELFLQAQRALERGDDDGALRALREAVDLDPGSAGAWEKIADILNKDGDYEGAAAAADKALAADPKDARAWRAKAYAEFQLGHYQAALDAAERAVALDPGNGLGFLYRAMAEEKLGLKDKAIADYRTAGRLDPALLPAALEGLKRLGAGPAPAPARDGWGVAKRVGVVGGSGLLLLLGLLGTTRRRRAKAAQAAATDASRGPAIVPEAATVALGAVIGGHYRVTGQLGRGGMGAVYLAQDESLQRPVAIKQLLRDGRGDAVEREGLLREARLVASLHHPHIAEIYSVITDADPLLVFEYVAGESLDKILKRSLKLAPARARRIVEETCAALAYAHGRGIIHRDLKPANVMIAEGGAAKVMDFGIAHQSGGGATRLTRASASGTPAYMAPEQALGSVSKASDLYALGVLAYELLTGARPFDGPDFLEPKLRGEFPAASSRNSNLPPSVDEFFARALNPDPMKRFAGAPELAAAFAAALEKVPTET